MHFPRRGTVQRDFSTVGCPIDDIGIQAFAIIDVNDAHLLSFDQMGRCGEVAIDGDRANVIQICAGDPNAVDFAIEYFNRHGGAKVGDVPQVSQFRLTRECGRSSGGIAEIRGVRLPCRAHTLPRQFGGYQSGARHLHTPRQRLEPALDSGRGRPRHP